MRVTFNQPRPSCNDEGFAEATVHEFIKQHYPDSYHEDALVAEEFRDGTYKALDKLIENVEDEENERLEED